MVIKLINSIKSRSNAFIVICYFTLANFINLIVSNPVTFPDSAGYILAGENIKVPIANGEIWSGETSGVLSFLGNSTRSWPNVLFYSLVQGNANRVFLQTFFYVLAFATLTICIEMVSTKNNKTLFIHLLNLILFLSPQIFQWNNIILSESFTISLIILGVATLILYLYNIKILKYIYLSIFIWGLVALIKFNFIIPLIFIVFIVFILQYKINLSFYKILMFAFVSIVWIIYISGVNKNISDTWGSNDKPSRNTVNFFFLTADGPGTPFGEFLRNKLPSDAPNCLINNPADDTRPSSHAGEMSTLCPEGVKWVNENYLSWYLNTIIENPSYALKYFRHYLPLTNSSAVYSPNLYIFIPNTFVHLYFTDNHVTHGFISSSLIALFILIPIFLVAVMTFKYKIFTVIFSLFGITSFVTLFSTILMMTAEIQRIVTPAITLLFLSTNLTIHFATLKK